jgi:hypothetical protein
MTKRQRPISSESSARGEGPRTTLVGRIRGILRTKNLTLYKISALTRVNYPHQPSYQIPRNLYFQLRSTVWGPTLHQLLALSRFSGYRLADWLGVFGFRLDEIPRLQATLHQPRTTLLDGSVYDAHATIPWVRDRFTEGVIPPVAPLSQLLESYGSRSVSDLVSMGANSYVYAKIGRQDAFAFPDLVPGSIVRSNSRPIGRILQKTGAEISKHIFLVEHSRGLCCCRLHFGTENRVTLTATQLPFANVELRLGSEARILGVLDLELRPLVGHKRPTAQRCAPPEVAPDLTRLWTPLPLDQTVGTPRAPVLIRSARRRAGLSLREASQMSREVARELHDNRYYASPGSLSEHEAANTPPRHIHKLFTVCVLYSIRLQELLHSFGLRLEETDVASIPDEWMARANWPMAQDRPSVTPGKTPMGGFVATLLERFRELPFFLRHALPSLSGLGDISLRDIFWVGGHQKPMHPSLTGALFVIVDRRKRRPRILSRTAAGEQPLYLLVRRDGSYVMASCGIENDAIVLHPYAEQFVPPERLRRGIDAEVVGQIVTVVRSLPPPP